MKKLILSLAVAAIVASGFGAYKAYQSFRPKNDFLAMNIEALAQGEGTESEADSETYQIAEATHTEMTTQEPGWTWDASLNVWLFNGKVSKKTPQNVSTITIKYKCCIRKGLEKCAYILCSENIFD